MPKLQSGQSLVELVMTVGLAAIVLPALTTAFVAARSGRAQQTQRLQAVTVLKQAETALKSYRNTDWATFAVNGTYHPTSNSGKWTLTSGSQTTNGYTTQIVIADVYRSNTGNIVTSGGTLDPSTKQATITVSWTQPYASSISTTQYLSRTQNLTYSQTTNTDFNTGTKTNTQITNTAGGEVILANDNHAKWCSPSFADSTIDLPDGPPVAVAATASATTNTIPNDVFVATAPNDSSSIKLAYVNVTANVATPAATLQGTFTLDSTKYSASGYIPSGIGITNSFKTNDVKYYKSSNGALYSLLATDMPDHEVIVIKIKNSDGTNAYQDPTNHIYTYWTYFNTKQYQGDSRSTPNQDQAPFGYGAVSIAILGTKGYIDSGGYLYVMDLSNIDSKSTSNGLDMVGCRIQLDGYDCSPGTNLDKKYNAGQTGATWGDTTAPAHSDCTDGGNVELYADHQLAPVQVGSNTYVYVAVGAATNPELDIVNATSIPTSGTSPTISSNSCGTSSGNSGWKKISSLDFDALSGTEEAANSVYAKSDGTRAYMASNGGVDANGDGIPDSDQFYVIDTSNKSVPKFLSTSTSAKGSVATSGYYNGSGGNIELFPRRALTVLNGQRAVLVGQDGYPSPTDTIEPQEYQVIDITTEATPSYCGGLNFSAGFNDLTSVSEADGDNFVYMVANTPDKQLKIIQGGPDSGIYMPSGTFTSAPFDAGYSAAFNRFVADINQPTGTTITMQVAVAAPVGGSCANATYTFVGPDGSTSSSYSVSGTTISGQIPLLSTSPSYTNPNHCFEYKVNYTSDSNQTYTPTLYDMTVNYSP